MAAWLDTVFYGFDYAILSAIHQFALATGGFFDWFMIAVTTLANDGLGMIALGLLLLLFKRTRKTGMAVLLAIAFGALITNVTLKPLVFRARPYTHEAFRAWWEAMGAHLESERSFPSGHTTSAMAAMMGIFLTTNKKRSWPALLFAVLMGITRMYLVVHYPTDIIGGLIAGAIGGLIGYFAARALFALLEKHRDKRLVAFGLDFDPILCGIKRLRGAGSPETDGESACSTGEDAPKTDGE